MNDFAIIITYFTSRKEAQPPPCFSATLKLLEKLPVDVYVIGGVTHFKDNYYQAKNVKYVLIELDEHVNNIRNLGQKYLNTDLIKDMKDMYRFYAINGWYCLHFEPMLMELYPEILSKYKYWGFMEIDILLNGSVEKYFKQTIEQNYDVLNCCGWSGSFRVLKNDETINTLWRNVELQTDVSNFFKKAVEFETNTGINSHNYGAYNESDRDGGYIKWLKENKKILTMDNGVYCAVHFRAYNGSSKFIYDNGELFCIKKDAKVPINYWNADTYVKFDGKFENEYFEESAYTEEEFLLKKKQWEDGKPQRY